MITKSLGVTLQNGNAQIRLWAPDAISAMLHVFERDVKVFLEAEDYGYWFAESEELQSGDLYWMVIDGEQFPDPVSRSQPQGVHGPSAVVDLNFEWTDQAYEMGMATDRIIYEIHVGSFTPSGDFEGLMEHLSYLKDLGITAIELMPVGQFPGERNWGYDGVYSFAVQDSYGGVIGLQRLVDAAHAQGLAVILDVVYNHFGPEGNYLSQIGPYFTDKYQTPWGKALNYDDAWSNGMRDYVLENVRMWFHDFHIDGLRLDAVHAIKDFSSSHILQDVRRVTDACKLASGKEHFLIVECDLNDRRYLEPLDKNGFAMDAQWLDEFHHALRIAAGGKRTGYYAEFEGVKHLAKAYESAYVFDGNFSTHRKKFFGSSADGLAGERFVVFSQNHDQVGNRALGERSSMLFSTAMQRLMALSVMVSPFTPLLFMGEEWASQKPFLYFISHSDEELIQAVREGRRREFEFASGIQEVPDPQAEDTFQRCVLDWSELEVDEHQRMLAYYRELLALRKNNPVLRNLRREDIRVECFPEEEVIVLWLTGTEKQLLCVLNFSPSESLELKMETLSFWDAAQPSSQPAKQWKKLWDTADSRWGGNSTSPDSFVNELNVSAQSGVIFEKG